MNRKKGSLSYIVTLARTEERQRRTKGDGAQTKEGGGGREAEKGDQHWLVDGMETGD
jgi:hypothetical protein